MGRRKKYVVQLTDEQREELTSMLHKGEHKSRKLNRARVLLLSDQRKLDREISEIVGVTEQTVRNIQERFLAENLESSLTEKPRPGAPRKLDAKGEACAIAMSCCDPPEGRATWTMQMIADKLVELKYVESISDEAVRLRLKKKR
jgi:transposase